jgi:hypothetical protein
VNPRPSLASSLVAHYPFDAAPVNNVIVDAAAGGEHPGTNSLATWTADVAGHTGVMLFSSIEPSQISVAPHSEFDSQRGTIAFWMKSPGTSPPGDWGSILFDRRSNVGDVIVMQDDGAIFTQTTGNSGRVSAFSTPGMVNDDNWHHIAYVYDQVPGGSIKLYIDGQLSVSNPISAAWSWDPTRTLEFGKSSDNYWKRFDGYMDDIRIYNRRLSATEIGQIITPTVNGPTLNFSRAGSQLSFSWGELTAVLQENSDITNPNGWVNVAGNPQSPTTITVPTTGMKFYRLRRP